MDWHDSDHSDDEHNHQGRADGARGTRKRSSRACDQCRKTKSKCEPSAGDSKLCKSCAAAGVVCTFLGPSYKRGPPKGYIHAIEQRWHQVEALIGAILQCPDDKVQNLVSDLRKDALAREILARVDSGPYGPSGRKSQPADATKEDFFASILKSNETAHVDTSRARRQSRVSREIVSSNQDHGLSVVPTKEWQDNLSNCLACIATTPPQSLENGSCHTAQKRRIGDYSSNQQDWDSLYKIEPAAEGTVSTVYSYDVIVEMYQEEPEKCVTEGIGLLSLDENAEVRWHGQSSGLHLLSRNKRRDDRIDGGVWRLPMARVWPPSHFYGHVPLSEAEFELPPQALQDELIEIYFTDIHPIFPVVDKSRFLAEYKQRKSSDYKGSPSLSTSSAYSSPRPEPTQEVTPLLLYSIFAAAARYTENVMPRPADGKMWEAGYEYVDKARSLLARVFHMSRPSTVQALLLLGFREFGIGSMEQGWLFIGSAIRMALDLGLNCDSSKWKMHGHDLFSPEDTQIRRQIWWACIVSDRYGSIYMGRPVMIKNEDFETQLPTIDPIEDKELWRPSITVENCPYIPVPGYTMSVLFFTSKLAALLGDVVTQIYPVKPISVAVKLERLTVLERRLDQWYISLPEYLRFDLSNKRYIPPPTVLFLQIRYWGSVQLLHRAFIPNWKPGNEDALRESSVGTRALDLAHSAACHVGSIVNFYRETFTMERASAYLTSFMLASSIVHLLMLAIRPDNVEASLSLQQIMTALKEMGVIWPSAARAFDLLNGVQLRQPPPTFGTQQRSTDRQKRARDAFDEDKPVDYSSQNSYSTHSSMMEQPTLPGLPIQAGNGVHEMSDRLMAHMLGLDVMGVDPTTQYVPGSHWYPRLAPGATSHMDLQNLQYPLSPEYGNSPQGLNVGPQMSSWAPSSAAPGNDYGMGSLGYNYDFGQYGV
ncbi:fungal-specific transcription factor domain-containing protein [Crepidotus variabilis]|uniref:Fungal-specific transcription factor domain-containing protein n=1 Tax=Crepidotus variabilis TaxID=179855 RepID=A0A9P6JTI5_9AGAR|nr:fungal-specific transcription factor domain-containing protein [Crepidotus variabilis]